jgi:hypothetical protein
MRLRERGLALLLAMACAAPLVLAPLASASAADAKKPVPTTKLKKNQAVLADDWAQRNVKSIAVMPVRALDGDEQALSLTRRALENSLADRGFKLLGGGSILATADRGGAMAAIEAAVKTFDAGAVLDTTSTAALHGALRTDALLLTNLRQWKRYVVDEYTRGASFTEVGIDAGMISLADGQMVWRGSFLEKMDGPYNEPQRGDQDIRDPGRNSKATAALEPPLYEEVLDKLMLRVAGTLPKPAANAPAAPAAPATK